jgi:uncharacterized membrane protein YeaQ/YmgE (transglycosylase-associated protein family)
MGWPNKFIELVGNALIRLQLGLIGDHMSFIAWIVLGLIAGFIGSKLVNRTGEGVLMDIVLGIIGAIVGGWLFNTFGMAGVTGLNVYSMVVAVIGAVVVLVLYHALARRRI